MRKIEIFRFVVCLSGRADKGSCTEEMLKNVTGTIFEKNVLLSWFYWETPKIMFTVFVGFFFFRIKPSRGTKLSTVRPV